MKLPLPTRDLHRDLKEFDIWITPSLGEKPETERAELLKALASTLYLVTGKSDNNVKCQFPLFLRDVAQWETLPVVTSQKNKTVIKKRSLPRTIKSDDFMNLISSIDNTPEKIRLLEQ